MKHSREPYRFDLSFTSRCKVSPSARAAVVRAAKATLEGLPARVLREKLRPDVDYGMSLTLIGPKTMRALNAGYRKKDRPTDVLSFSRLEGMPTPHPEVGDILICWPVAQAQAKEYGLTVREELARLTVHGVLHLFGYDHETNARDAKKMFALQNKILRALFA